MQTKTAESLDLKPRGLLCACARQGSARFSASRPRVVRCAMTPLPTQTQNFFQNATKNALFRIFFTRLLTRFKFVLKTGVQIPHLSAFKSEKEVLLRPGMSAVSVSNISTCFTKTGSGQRPAVRSHSFISVRGRDSPLRHRCGRYETHMRFKSNRPISSLPRQAQDSI